VFIVWALATAYLHGLRFYRPDGFLGRTLPALALLTGVAVLVSMLVTRTAVLASSHRYIGDTSFPVLALLAGILLVLTLTAWMYAATRKPQHRRRLSENTLLIYSAVIIFGLIAGVALWQLAQAYIAAYLELPRPASLKPFFETLTRWTQPHERTILQQVFAQWDVDNFAINAWLAPLGVLIGLFGGHAFLKLHSRRLRWAITAAAAVAALLVAYYLQPMDIWYNGTGMTSKQPGGAADGRRNARRRRGFLRPTSDRSSRRVPARTRERRTGRSRFRRPVRPAIAGPDRTLRRCAPGPPVRCQVRSQRLRGRARCRGYSPESRFCLWPA
jgi:cytochrome c-type biogenesis protein CcmF